MDTASVDTPPTYTRLELLCALRSGAGVRVVTGPAARAYWGLVSREVQVTVWPDGYDWKERTDEWQWALEQVGALELYNSHVRKGKEPSARHRLFDQFNRAHALLSRMPSGIPSLVHEDVPFTLQDIPNGLSLLDEHLTSGTMAALDWEWHRQTQEPVGLSISGESSTDNVYVPVWASDVDNRSQGTDLQKGFGSYLRAGGRAVLHGGRADLGTQVYGDPIDLLADGKYQADDTMVMAYLLGETVLGLKPLSNKYLGVDPIENDREWAEENARFTGRYAAAGDTRNTYDLWESLSSKLVGRQRDVYERIEKPLVPVIASMEKYGTPVDIAAVRQTYADHLRIETGLQRAVYQLYGRDLSSDDDTRRFITDCGFTDPGTLDQRVISLNPHWCIDLILEYRRTRTRRRNFLKGVLRRWVEAGKPAEFRVYPRFNQAGSMVDSGPSAPRTGRLSSADPNLMNQPRDIRFIYVPPPGCVWWSYDYSGLELRIAAGLSQDPVMLQAFEEGRDMHGEFQQFIKDRFGVDVGRPAAKTGNFEQLYEGGAAMLVRILAKLRVFITMADAQAIVDAHHERHAVYHEWGQDQVALARSRGYAETLGGRSRTITEYTSSDGADHSHGDRAAQNHPVQGTAADVVKQVMVRLARDVFPKYDAHMCIQVHDEIDGWIPADARLEDFDREVREVMESYSINGLKLAVEGGFGANWSEAH